MPLSNDSLATLAGRVRNHKPNAKPEQVRTWLNDAIRDVINARTYWADLLTPFVIACPGAYTAGLVGTVTGSRQVSGTGTSWPVSDVVNTTLGESVNQPGVVEIALTSMLNVQEDGILLVDVGAAQEAVPILRVTPYAIQARFNNVHAAGALVTQSSLAGLQFRIGRNYPYFTVMAIVDGSTLLLDNPWGGPPLSGQTYQILKMLYHMHARMRKPLDVVDQQQGWPLDLNAYSITIVNQIDPQRSDTGDPRTMFPHTPSPSGNMRWEVWPAPTSARQIACILSLQWPEMVDLNDVPPPFLEATIFSDLAVSTALATKLGPQDAWYLPKDSIRWEQQAAAKLTQAMNNDEDRNVRDYSIMRNSTFGRMNFNWHQSHSAEAIAGNF